MYNSDYIPLDKAVIDDNVKQFEQNRNEAKSVIRDAMKDARGNIDIIVFPRKRSIIKALDGLGIFWGETDGEILVSRHEVYDVLGMK